MNSYSGTSASTPYGMAPGTSPAIAGLSTGGYLVAFQGLGTGDLYVVGYDGAGGPANPDTGLVMAPDTSPSFTAMGGSNIAIAIQANTGYLWTWVGTPGLSEFAGMDTHQGMAHGTRPSAA